MNKTKQNKTIQLKKRNKHFDFLFKNFDEVIFPYRYFLLYGGASSGKSYSVAMNILLRMMNEKIEVYAFRKESTTARKSVFKTLKSVISDLRLDTVIDIKIKETTMEIIFGNGSLLTCAGMDNSEKIKSIPDLDIIWLEEFTGFEENDFMEALRRLRGNYKDKRIYMTMNPISATSWIKPFFFDNPSSFIAERLFKNHSNIENNIFSSDEDKEIYRRMIETNENDYRIYYLGQFGVLNGKVFNNYKVLDEEEDEFIKRYRKENLTDRLQLKIGMDFGWNDPTVIIKSYFSAKTNSLYIVDEYYSSETTIKEIAKIIQRSNFSRNKILADSANKQQIQSLNRDYNLNNVIAVKKPKIEESIKYLQSLNIYILSKCTNTLLEFENLQQNRNGKFVGNDHAIDSIRYSLSETFRDYEPLKISRADFGGF